MIIIQTSPGINSSEIANQLQTSTRTVQRYIKQLREAGLIIEASSGHMGGFLCRNGYKPNPMYLTFEEQTILTLAVNTLISSEGFPFNKELSSALNKIYSSSSLINNRKEDFLSIMLPPRGNNEQAKRLIVEVKEAMNVGSKIEIEYDSFSSQQVNRRTINPYHVFLHDGFWYLVGFCNLRSEIRTFRIDRIKQLKVLNEKFQVDQDFNIDEYIKNSWSIAKGEKTKVVIKFSPPISRLILETMWHESQQIENLDDGTLLFTVEVEGTWEIKKWVYGFGKYAEVMEPESLRQEVKEEIGVMLGRYDRDEC